jgi:hypothetical protein
MNPVGVRVVDGCVMVLPLHAARKTTRPVARIRRISIAFDKTTMSRPSTNRSDLTEVVIDFSLSLDRDLTRTRQRLR